MGVSSSTLQGIHSAPLSLGSFPHTRMRRMRRTGFLRGLAQEASLEVRDLIWPVFITPSASGEEPIQAMPGVMRLSEDGLIRAAGEAQELGIRFIALFPVIPDHLKDSTGQEAWNPKGLIPQRIALLKKHFPDMGVIADVALDPYTSHGQDGLVDEKGYILNDQTLEALSRQALCCAEAGVDILAPSDMMDGRIGFIRRALEEQSHPLVCLLSYAAKYSSSFYGPFRQAVGSHSALKGADKKNYQMNPCNSDEALREVALDLQEGADMVMVKPAQNYLDVLWRVKQTFQVPTLGYQVSGEYASLKAAAQLGFLDEKSSVLEALTACKRAGADGILTYYACEAARWLRHL